MKKLLLFSETIPFINHQLRFARKRAARWLSIFFKRKRSIKIEKLHYYKYWHFENASLVIEFQFRNAIWFKVGNKKFIDIKTPLVLNLANIPNSKITLTIRGLGQLLTYEINLAKEARLTKNSFKSNIQNLRARLVQASIQYRSQQLYINAAPTHVRVSDISITTDDFFITPTPFKLQYYI